MEQFCLTKVEMIRSTHQPRPIEADELRGTSVICSITKQQLSSLKCVKWTVGSVGPHFSWRKIVCLLDMLYCVSLSCVVMLFFDSGREQESHTSFGIDKESKCRTYCRLKLNITV
jgi:hypothetical protein